MCVFCVFVESVERESRVGEGRFQRKVSKTARAAAAAAATRGTRSAHQALYMPSSSSSEPPPPPRASTIGGRFRALDPRQRILLGVFGMVFSGLGLFLSENLEKRGTLEAAAARRDAKAIQGPEAAR